MNLRLTPLNIVSSVLLVSVAYLLIFSDENGFRKLGAIPLIMMLVLTLVIDLIFRRLVPDLKKIWLMEAAFLMMVGVLAVLIGLS